MDTTQLHLLSRGLFSHSPANHTCPKPDTSGPAIVPLIGSMSFGTFATIVAGATSIFTILLSLALIFRHATNYTVPKEQRQIIRIGCYLPWVTVLAFLCVWLESAGEYIAPGIDLGTALALSSFLLLLCNYVLANPDGLQDLFGNTAYGSASPAWLKKTWYCVLQFIPVSIILWIATVASLAAGTYCDTSNKIYFVHIWVTVIRAGATAVAIISIFRFHKIMKAKLAPHKIMLKFFSFKGVVLLMFVQTFVINILVSSHVIKPTQHLSYQNLKVGIPNLLITCELPIFAAAILYAYRVTPYNNGKPAHGAVKAILQALNYSDILSSFIRGPMRLLKDQERMKGREGSMPLIAPPSYNAPGNPPYNAPYNAPIDFD